MIPVAYNRLQLNQSANALRYGWGMASLARRRFHVLVAGAVLLSVGAVAGTRLSGGLEAVLSFAFLSGERVRLDVDASVGRSESEQLTRDLTRAATSTRSFQIRQSRQAMMAMGVEGAETMPDEEIERRIAEAQERAMQSFYGSQSPGRGEFQGLRPIR